jgi:hypothetical protein
MTAAGYKAALIGEKNEYRRQRLPAAAANPDALRGRLRKIAGSVWLMLKYTEARQLAFKTAGRFISKEEFLAAPQYSIAVTPLTLVFLMQNRMSYANLILSGQPAQNGAERVPPIPNPKKQAHELRIASKH